MPWELTQPWYLLGLVALPVLAWYFVRGLTDFSRWQRVTSLVVRSLVVALLVAEPHCCCFGLLCSLCFLCGETLCFN